MKDAEIEVAESFVDIPGGKVFVKTWTPPVAAEKPPVVLLHDSLGCTGLWKDFPEKLAARLSRPIISYDRLGFGKSSPRRELPSLNFVREEAETYFPALRQALEFEEYALFGYSVGGAMALAIAASDPQHCQAVVSESAQAFVEERTREGLRAAKARFEDRVQMEKLRRWHGDNADWVLRAWTETWLSDAFASWRIEPELARVRCPVLAIHGDRDEFGSVAFPETIVRGVKGKAEMLILDGCGHSPHREREQEVMERTAKFLGS
jgi:pimeloyl-ACP methyl ester carboxylesterase